MPPPSPPSPPPPLSAPALLVLDLDGTLVDTLDDLAASLAATLGARSLPAPPRESVRGMIGDGLAALVRRGFARAGAEATEADIARMGAHYAAHGMDRSRLYPGAAEALDAAEAAGFALAVCTNKPEAAARALLDRLGVGRRMAAVTGGDTTPWRKPDGRHLAATLRAAGIAADRAVMVGDHDNDVDAARAAGVAAIRAAWGYGAPRPDGPGVATARDWSEVPGLAAAMLARTPPAP